MARTRCSFAIGMLLLLILSACERPHDSNLKINTREAVKNKATTRPPRSDNGLQLELIWCPPGSFHMGSPSEDVTRFDNESGLGGQSVKVAITRGFWIGRTEVTQAQWLTAMKTSPWDGKDFIEVGPDYPAVYVSYDDAVDFCRALTDAERNSGRIQGSSVYRLPTEAEWEYACRAGTAAAYSFGDDVRALSEYAWWGGLVGGGNTSSLQPVARKKPNPWGLYDMHGNVSEWCTDIYADLLPGGVDPVVVRMNPVTLGDLKRVSRGGSWAYPADTLRSAARSGDAPSSRDYASGFRVVLDEHSRLDGTDE